MAHTSRLEINASMATYRHCHCHRRRRYGVCVSGPVSVVPCAYVSVSDFIGSSSVGATQKQNIKLRTQMNCYLFVPRRAVVSVWVDWDMAAAFSDENTFH